MLIILVFVFLLCLQDYCTLNVNMWKGMRCMATFYLLFSVKKEDDKQTTMSAGRSRAGEEAH